MEKFREEKRNLGMVFIDVLDTHDRQLRLEIIYFVWRGSKECENCVWGDTIVVHPGPTLSFWLFVLVLDIFTTYIQLQVVILWRMLFAGNVVLVRHESKYIS